MRTAALAGLLAVALPGCAVLSGVGDRFGSVPSLRGTPQDIGGIRFRSRVAAVADDPRSFRTTTRDARRGVPQAIEAGRIEAIRYCLTRYGGSNIAWRAGPDRPSETIAVEDGVLVLSGRCLAR